MINVLQSSVRSATCLFGLQSGSQEKHFIPTTDSFNHGYKDNTRLTRFFNPTRRKSVRWRHCQSENGGLQCCVWLLAEIPSSWAVFDLNNRKSGVNRHLRFLSISKKTRKCAVLGAYYSLNHGTTHCIYQNAYSLQIYDYLSQGISANSQSLHWRTAFSDWQLRHARFFLRRIE